MIDWDQVRQLEDDMGADDFGEIVEAFIQEIDEAVSKLSDLDTNDASAIAAALHFIKGSSANLGFLDLFEVCSKGEILAETGKTSEVDLCIVQNLYENSKVKFLSGLAVEIMGPN